MGFLKKLPRNIGDKDAVDAIAIIARSNADEYACSGAVSDLVEIPGKYAEKALTDMAANETSPLYWRSIRSLAQRHNPVALGPLLNAAADKDPRRRSFSILALTGFRNIPEVHEILTGALKDADPSVRESAKQALEWVEREE